MSLLTHYNHWVVIVLMMTGMYVIMARDNLVKKVLGLNVFQASVILMYVTMAKVDGGTAAILVEMPEHGDAHGDHAAADAHAVDDAHGDHGPEAHGDHATETPGDHAGESEPRAPSHESAHRDASPAHALSAHPPEPPPHHPQATTMPLQVGAQRYSNPLPHVLMLTAIVVGVATTAVALALVVRIQEAFGTIEDDELLAIEEGDG